MRLLITAAVLSTVLGCATSSDPCTALVERLEECGIDSTRGYPGKYREVYLWEVARDPAQVPDLIRGAGATSRQDDGEGPRSTG